MARALARVVADGGGGGGGGDFRVLAVAHVCAVGRWVSMMEGY